MEAMRCAGLTPDEIRSLVHATANDEAAGTLPAHLQLILQDLLQNTYFTIQGLPNPCQTTRGTRPGDPIADVLFNLCMHLILTDFRQEMDNTAEVPWLGNATPVDNLQCITQMKAAGYVDVTFVDDCVVLIHGRTNEQVMHTMKTVVMAMDGAASKRGLSINYDRGKTEALWTIVGKGARSMKQEIHAAAQTLQWQGNTKHFTLQICHAYKHLGTWLQAGHRHAKESLARGAAAKQQYGQLARSFFTKKSVSLPVKSAVFQSLVLSKMLYNVHTWTSVTQKHMDQWTNHLKGPAGTLLKGMLLAETRFQHTTDEMLAYAGLLPLIDQVHANRLRFLARLLKHCPQITWTLMHSTTGHHSWIHQCMESCQWMLKHYDSALPLTADSPFMDWVQFVQLDYSWKGRVRKTCRLWPLPTTVPGQSTPYGSVTSKPS